MILSFNPICIQRHRCFSRSAWTRWLQRSLVRQRLRWRSAMRLQRCSGWDKEWLYIQGPNSPWSRTAKNVLSQSTSSPFQTGAPTAVKRFMTEHKPSSLWNVSLHVLLSFSPCAVVSVTLQWWSLITPCCNVVVLNRVKWPRVMRARGSYFSDTCSKVWQQQTGDWQTTYWVLGNSFLYWH